MSDSMWDSLVRTREAIRAFESNRNSVNEFNHDGTWILPVSVGGFGENRRWNPAGYDLPMPVPDNYPVRMTYVPIFNISAYRRIRFTP